ncbi:MAG: aminoglycoside phosphotransferase family protein [Chloroflexota bacterium]
MISHDITPEIVQAIWDKHNLGKIETIERPSRGIVNHTSIVNDAYVIRFDVLEDYDWPGISRYASEKWAYETLRGSDVPVPDVIAYDASKTLAPYDYLILSKLPGKTVHDSLVDLTAKAQHTIAYRAGEYLATIHSYAYPSDGFGLLFNVAAGVRMADWAAYVAYFFQDYIGQVRKLGLLPEAIFVRIEAVRAKMGSLLALVQQGQLVHGDYHFSNMLQQNGEISGVIDFEWAQSGDPSWDFRIDDDLETSSPGSSDAFYAGYISRRALPDHHAERVALYRVGLYLDYLTFEDDSEHDLTRGLLLKELVWLEARLSGGDL